MTLNINSDFVREDKERIKTNQKIERYLSLTLLTIMVYSNAKRLVDRMQGYKLK